MNFGEALNLIKKGKEVTRTGWNGKRMYVYLVLGQDGAITIRQQLNMKAADGSYGSWAISHTDALADDWELSND